MRKFITLCGLMTIVLVSAGCQRSVYQVYEGYESQQVWQAMVDAANAPMYSNWHVNQNFVSTDRAARRIDVHRELIRDSRIGNSQSSWREVETYDYLITLNESDAGHPLVRFKVREVVAVPAHVWDEADQYFEDLEAKLGDPVRMPADDMAGDMSDMSDDAMSDDAMTDDVMRDEQADDMPDDDKPAESGYTPFR